MMMRIGRSFAMLICTKLRMEAGHLPSAKAPSSWLSVSGVEPGKYLVTLSIRTSTHGNILSMSVTSVTSMVLFDFACVPAIKEEKNKEQARAPSCARRATSACALVLLSARKPDLSFAMNRARTVATRCLMALALASF